jgi:hypothetical protein
LIHSVQKNLNEHGEKLDEKTKTEVSDALEAAKKGTTQINILLPSLHNYSYSYVTNLSTSSSLLSYSPVDPEAEIEALKEAVANLSGASMKIGQAIYSKKGDESTPDDENKKDDKKEDAQEAEFTEKKK